jgi:hypothetical protein
MKVNEVITEAGVWQGIKNVGRGLGQIAGGAATKAVQGLDLLAGGSGDVGTVKQRVQRKLKQTTQNLANINRELPQQALANFESQMGEQGIDINDPRTFNPQTVRNSLRDFGLQFFAGGEEDAIKAYIAQTIQFEPLPGKIDNKTVLNYFRELTKIRSNAVLWVAQNQSSQEIQQAQQAQQAQQGPALTQGVSVVNSADPLILRYKNTDFALTSNDRWVYFGSNKEASPEMTQFLNKQLSKL